MERHKNIEEIIPHLQAEVDYLKINSLSGDQIRREAQDLYGRWPALERDEKGRIVEAITENIVVGKEGISINLYLPSSEEMANGWRKGEDSNLRYGYPYF